MDQTNAENRAEKLKQLSRGVGCDMSSQAILHRLEIVSQLFELTQALSRAQRIVPSCSNEPAVHELTVEP